MLSEAVETALKADGVAKVKPKKSLEEDRPEPPPNLFKEINALRNPPQVNIDEAEAAERAKYTDTIFGQIAGSKVFEFLTLGLISLNAVAIGYDTDYSARWGKPDNLYDGPVGFIIIEWTFATYFTCEVVIRFIAYKNKIQCLCDPWFVFDSVLVTMMVFETWILPFVADGGPFAQLSILRLLRLLRITRMARIMRAVPEMMVIIKGMVAATRTVLCTGALLFLVLYTFCILFTNEYHQGKDSDSIVSSNADNGDVGAQAQVFFGSMGKSMFTLFIMGTVLDDVTQATNAIRDSKNNWMLLAFIIFILISSFMMLNMLIGVLVEVVGATAEGEREKNIESNVREAIGHIFEQMDADSNKEISRSEFLAMRKDKQIMEALSDLDIHSTHFHLYAELFFRPEEQGGPMPSLTFDKLVNLILRLRPGSFVSALDFAAFAKSITGIHDRIKERVIRVERLCLEIAGETLPNDGTQSQHTRKSGRSEGGTVDCHSIASKETHKTDQNGVRSHLKIPGATEFSNIAGPAPETTQNRFNNGTTPHNSAPSDRDHDKERLEKTATADIIEELQRRLGMTDLDKTGVPYSMLDEELQNRLKAASEQGVEGSQNCAKAPTEQGSQAYMTLGVPQHEEDNGTVYV